MARWFRRRQRSVWGLDPDEVRWRFEGPDLAGLAPRATTVRSVAGYVAFGSDHAALERVRVANRDWLEKWEASLPPDSTERLPTWAEYPSMMDEKTSDGDALTMIVEVNDEVAGVVTLGAIERGAMQLGILGYWLAQKWAGQGVASLAVAATVDLILTELGLHRVDVNVRPSNRPSLALCRKLGMREEGYKPRYMNIGGRWEDHVAFAVDQEMVAERPLLARLAQREAHRGSSD